MINDILNHNFTLQYLRGLRSRTDIDLNCIIEKLKRNKTIYLRKQSFSYFLLLKLIIPQQTDFNSFVDYFPLDLYNYIIEFIVLFQLTDYEGRYMEGLNQLLL